MRRTLGHPIRAGSWVLGMFSRPVRKYSRDSEEILSCSVTGEKLWVARVAKTRWPCVNRSGLEGSTRGDGEEFAALRWGGAGHMDCHRKGSLAALPQTAIFLL